MQLDTINIRSSASLNTFQRRNFATDRIDEDDDEEVEADEEETFLLDDLIEQLLPSITTELVQQQTVEIATLL